MATIYKEIDIDAPAAKVWSALRDFGALHQRLAPGFVTACRIDADANSKGDIRVVTFFNGNEIREQLVGLDDQVQRIAYTVVGGKATHHHASAQVIADNATRCRFVWITDVLPDEFAVPIAAMMERGAAVMKSTLEKLE